jgi:hypothetical protein
MLELVQSGDRELDAWRRRMWFQANGGCCGAGGHFEI